MMQGYIGAHPKPTNTKEINDISHCVGKNITRIPNKIMTCPILIICLSFNLIAIKPLTPLPIVIPIQNTEAKEVATFSLTALAKFK